MNRLNRRLRIRIDREKGEPRFLEYVPGPLPYLWIGDDMLCYGHWSPTKKGIEKLERMIEGFKAAMEEGKEKK